MIEKYIWAPVFPSLDLLFFMPVAGQLGQRLGVRDIKSVWSGGEDLASALGSQSKAPDIKLFYLEQKTFWISSLASIVQMVPNVGESKSSSLGP